MKILVTGANGLLGQHLVKLLLQQSCTVIATGRGTSRLPFQTSDRYSYYSMDISNALEVEDLLQAVQPEVIVHAAAMTQVDECEQNSRQCEQINVQGTIQLLLDAEACASHFIYVSTDFVFDGLQGNYKETDALSPVSFYGFTKMQAESMVETCGIPWTIVRTCLVYGNVLQGTRSNIINWVKNSLQEGKSIKVVSDQWRTPTWVEDLAWGIWLIIEQKAEGVFHISGKDLLTPYDMAVKTAGLLQLDASKLEKVDAATFTQPGKRPPKTGFDISKAREQLGYEPLSFEEGLKKMLMEGREMRNENEE